MTKIYTRTGDKGETSLFTGERVSKDNSAMEALGTVDECNSAIGLAVSLLPDNKKFHKTREQLILIQHTLFDLGAALATPRTKASNSKIEKTRFDDEGTLLLEQWMDEIEAELPPLKTFILPGGHAAGAALHLGRSICRRAERLIIPLHRQTDVSNHVLMYINRLSDYLFMASRFINHVNNTAETIWEHHKPSSVLN